MYNVRFCFIPRSFTPSAQSGIARRIEIRVRVLGSDWDFKLARTLNERGVGDLEGKVRVSKGCNLKKFWGVNWEESEIFEGFVGCFIGGGKD